MKCLNNLKRKDLQINGIYKITNIENKKFYIGSCSSKTFLYERLKHHEQDLLNNRHCNKYLQRSFNKYGIQKFYYEIIEECEINRCIEREQYWIDLLNPEYNLQKIAGSSLGRIVSEETKIKISESNKRFWMNPKNKERMRISFKNRNPRKKKEKIIKLKHGHCKKVIDLNTNITYISVIELSKNLNISYSYLISILNGNRKNTLNIKYVE